MRSSRNLQGGPKSSKRCVHPRHPEGSHREGGSHRAETQPQATEHLEPPTWKEARKEIPAQRDEGRTGRLTPDSALSRASRTTREYKFDVLSHEFVVICSGSHRKPMQMARQREQQGSRRGRQRRAGRAAGQGRVGRVAGQGGERASV